MCRRLTGTIVLAGSMLGFAVLPCWAAEPSFQLDRPLLQPVYSACEQLQRSLARVQPPEIAELLTAMTQGGGLGPGQGWFHASQSRYGWEWLAARHGIRPGGRIARKDFQGSPEVFELLDRNHDGVLTAEDFDWSDRSPLARERMLVGWWFRRISTKSNGRISPEEWQAFFKQASKGKGYLTPDDLREAFPMRPPAPPPGPQKDDGPSLPTLLRGLASGELGSVCEGPGLGQRAPDFILPTEDGKQSVRLAEYRGKKPVVLVFGSFT